MIRELKVLPGLRGQPERKVLLVLRVRQDLKER